jgi:hypothetical protein
MKPIFLEPIDSDIEPRFDLSVVADYKKSDGTIVERVYRCTVGAKDKSEAYEKLRNAHCFSWWIAEHAYRGGPLLNQDQNVIVGMSGSTEKPITSGS